MKNHRPVWLVFACLLALSPSFLSGRPWDPNLPRPAGFQRTLGYLADDFQEYPNAELQSIRSKMLTQDNATGIVAALQNSGIPPSGWEAEAQKTYDVWAAQYEQLKTATRQTMTNAGGIIQAVEGNQPLSAELAGHPNVRALIAARWRLINLGEQTYQALVYAGLLSGGGSGDPQTSVPIINSRKPAKSQNRIDWERTRETWRRAIERRRAFEAQLAEKNRRHLAEILELIRYLQNHGALSTNKFKSTRPGAGSGSSAALSEPEPAPAASEPTAAEPVDVATQPIEEIVELEEEAEELRDKIAAEEGEKPAVTKVKVYGGTLVLRRPADLTDDAAWQSIKKSFIAMLAPGTTDMEDRDYEVTWRYRMLTSGGYPFKSTWLQDIPDREPTEEEVDGGSAPPKEEKPKFVGNGDASPGGMTVPGTEQPAEETLKPQPSKFAAKPAPAKTKPAPAKPEPTKPAPVPGYWFDPNDNDANDPDPTIYVRVDGVAVRVPLSEAQLPPPRGYGVPRNATVETMTWYSERTGKIVPNKNRGTHQGKP